MIKDCMLCDLCFMRKNIVNGIGNLKASLMIIGEAPGYYEDKHGIPFYPDADSGKFLTSTLFHYGFTREQIYITNIIKCRPAQNRTPSTIEIRNCKEHLLTELNIVKPKILMLLGRTALTAIFTGKLSIGAMRGTITKIGDMYVVPTYHPSHVLRNKGTFKYTELYNTVYKDFKLVYDLYRIIINPLHTSNNLIL